MMAEMNRSLDKGEPNMTHPKDNDDDDDDDDDDTVVADGDGGGDNNFSMK